MTAGGGTIDTGALFREVHQGCWRADAPPLELSLREVTALMPLLIRTGSVGLVWPRLRHRAAELGATGAGLEAAYQAQVEHNARVEREIARVVGHLQGHGIDPVLIKGWAVSRLYPAGIVRPAGDIDLVVRDKDYERAKALLAGGTLSLHRDYRRLPEPSTKFERDSAIDLDLHSASRWNSAPGDGCFERSAPVPVGDVPVRTLSPEDNLRALSFHFLGHSAVRPLRLCDVSMVLESRPPDFDWDRCLAGTRRQRELVDVTLRLAHHFLGTRLSGTPISDNPLPLWLVAAVERQWEVNPTPPGTALPQFLRNPAGVLNLVQRRWPDPITATMRTGARFDEAPRPPIQRTAFLRQLGYYLVRELPRQAREVTGAG